MFWDQDSQAHKVQSCFFLFYICDFPKILCELFQPSQTTCIPGHETKYIIQARSLFRKTYSRSLFEVATILGWPGRSSEPFCHSHRGFPPPSPSPTELCMQDWCVKGLISLSCTYSTGLKSSVCMARGESCKKECVPGSLHGDEQPTAHWNNSDGKLGHNFKAGQTIHPLVPASITFTPGI